MSKNLSQPLLSAKTFSNSFSTAFFRANPNIVRRNDKITWSRYHPDFRDITLPEFKAMRITVEYTTGIAIQASRGEFGNIHLMIKPVDKFEISLN